jgi:hypothetical protein
MFISNIGMKKPRVTVGVDQMQAILLAFEGVLTTLQNSGIKWTWIHGEDGDIGIPRFVPQGFGRRFAAKLETIIDRETDKFGNAARRRHFRNLKKKARRGARRLITSDSRFPWSDQRFGSRN